MDENQTFWQRYGGYLVLLSIAVLLFVGGRAIARNNSLASESVIGTVDSEGLPGSPVDDAGLSPDRLAAPSSASEPNSLDGIPILVNNSLSPALDPFTYEGKRPEHDLTTYVVQPLDTPIGIAEKFGIKPETLLGGNAFLSEEANALQPGVELIILPIDGVLHNVQEGNTLEGISHLYGIPAEEIIAYGPNNLEFPFRLYPGTDILVPGAVREVFVWSAPSLPSRPSTSDSTGSGISPLIQGTGTFVWPVTYRRITQAYWYGHQAIDIGVPEGSPVVASDTGTVTWAGWNVYGYGNLIVINHGNGYETYYAHLSAISVVPGQIVYQGNYIGASGNTGRSSGPHLHFEIRYFNALLVPTYYLP
jgi:murein DD-endopeptidase MepM/ murein hydrolase activator NlpD